MLLYHGMSVEEEYPISRFLNIRQAYNPSFLADGGELTFLSNITGIPQIWRVKAGDKIYWPMQLTFESERVQWLTSSPLEEDRRIIFGRDVGGNEKAQLYLLEENGLETCLTEGYGDAMHLPGKWVRDGKGFLFAANRRDPHIFDAYLASLEGGTELIWENDESGYLRDFTLSPDGNRFICSRNQSSFSHQLLEIDISSRKGRDISPSRDMSRYVTPCYADTGSIYLVTDVDMDYMYLAKMYLDSLNLEPVVTHDWDVKGVIMSPDKKLLCYEVNVEGVSQLYLYNIEEDRSRKLNLGDTPGVVYDNPVFSQDPSKLAFSYSKATAPMDIYVWDLDEERLHRATNSSTGGIPQETFKVPELVSYPTFDNDESGEQRMIPAWLYRNPEGGESPVIVLVHGGPESQTRPLFDFRVQYFLNKGYSVFLPNVRGSTGYGKIYSHLDDARKRMDSVRDLAMGVKWLEDDPQVDGEGIVVMGGSYGGFMVLSAITTYPDLWVAAVDVVGISNLATFLENTSDYRRKHREAEYGSLKEDRKFLERIAPINHIDQIETPLMVIQGANDPRVPLTESEQMVKALREEDKPVEYIVFEDEGHGIYRLKNKMTAYPAIIKFIEKHLNK